MKKPDYYRLIAKKLSGEISSDEEYILNEWMKASPENLLQHEKAASFCEQVKSIHPPESPDLETEWAKLKHEIRSVDEKTDDVKVPTARKYKRDFSRHIYGTRFRYGPAVVLTSILMLCLSIYIWKVYFSEPSLKRLTTQNGHQTELTLTDGSHIRLNSGSTLNYPKSFSRETRKIYLSGEAFFNVKKDKRPFVVITDNAKTTVLGTRFNVWARYGKTRIIVKQGSVRFEPIHSEDEAVFVTKEKMSEITADSPPERPRSIETDDHLGWLVGKLIFRQKPLNEIIGELERHYGVSIGLAVQDTGLSTLTGSFKDMPLDTVLTSICLTLNMKVVKEDGRYGLYK